MTRLREQRVAAASAFAAFLFLGAAACSEPANPVTAPSAIDVSTFVFTGTLAVGGEKFYSFTVSNDGTIQAMLASLTAGGTAVPTARVQFALGVPAGTGCRPLTAITAAPALVPQLTSNLAEGIYCVSVTDTGTLTRDMNFAIRVMHP